MNMLSPLLGTNPASPRLTVYDDARGTRMEFSGVTLENWASKVANMLVEEFELEPGAEVGIDLPSSWQAAVVALGAYTASCTPLFDVNVTPNVIFTSVERACAWAEVPDCVVVSDDPFGRGVVEAGGELLAGTIDFGPTVRFYGDYYDGPSPDLADWARPGVGSDRYLIPAWGTAEEFAEFVLAPLAAGGSVVLVVGLVSAERQAQIIEAEKVTHVLTPS